MGAPFDKLRAMCTQLHVVAVHRDNRFYPHPVIFDGDTLDHQPEELLALLKGHRVQAVRHLPSAVALELLRLGALTIHRFGKDLVAHVSAVNYMLGPCEFVTDLIPGAEAENDEAPREFLGQLAETFAEAGLSVWQK